MGRKCPPGVICFENITIIFILVILASVMLFINNRITQPITAIQPSIIYRANDVLLNPYHPPIRDNRFNVDYRQVGILTRMNGVETILPLMGKPVHVARDKWNFYTMKDSHSMVKLPIIYKGKSCTNEYGCDNLYNEDVVYVEGYKDTFKVTIYDNQSANYCPHL